MSDTPPQQTPAQLREAYERSQARVAELEQQNAQTESVRRENAFLKAGVDSDSPIGKFFTENYKGGLTVEEVSKAWSELAPAAPTPTPEPTTATTDPAPSEEPTAEELAQAAARTALTTGATAPGAEPEIPAGQAMLQTYLGAKAKGRPDQVAQRQGLQVLFDRASQGDTTALYQAPGESPGAARDRWKAGYEE